MQRRYVPKYFGVRRGTFRKAEVRFHRTTGCAGGFSGTQSNRQSIWNCCVQATCGRSGRANSDVPPAGNENNAINPPPDWAAELSRAARDAVSNESSQNPRAFGHAYPSAATPDKPAQFGWDYAATHRVEHIPGGGLLLHINDNCALVLFPLPLVGCAIGKRRANGELFEHMRDR